ncbi:MAG: hypothetical protein D3903_22345 [Candidatus Electrothrix sp. GM3_4]|nr:hypothetical protein [Candidatus Electrothrix sp. GM3_4]
MDVEMDKGAGHIFFSLFSRKNIGIIMLRNVSNLVRTQAGQFGNPFVGVPFLLASALLGEAALQTAHRHFSKTRLSYLLIRQRAIIAFFRTPMQPDFHYTKTGSTLATEFNLIFSFEKNGADIVSYC